MTRPTIYRRWRSKADLAKAAMARVQAREPTIPAGSPRERLVTAVTNFQTALLRPGGMSLIGTLLTEERHLPDLMRGFRERVLAPRRETMRQILTDAAQAGELHPEADVDAAVNLLVGSLYARYLAGKKLTTDWPRRVVNVVWEGIRRRSQLT